MEDIKNYIQDYLQMDLLRFTTAGSVDDGKSTLIGRLLYSTKSIFEDQMAAIEKTSRDRGDDYVNLALLTDGLRAEREQGITIDVAYKYFATPKRKFIIADTPGHVQYTRNMVTGASNANLAIILVDARKGVIEQTKRHSFIASLLKIPHVVVAINKMDLVEYSQKVFDDIQKDYESFATRLDLADITFIPISALNGDNIVERASSMSWYQGTTLLNHLETVHIANDSNFIDARFPVQYVIRPMSKDNPDYRSFSGRVASGVFKKGEEVTVLPSGFTAKIKAIDTYNGEIEEAYPPLSVAIRLDREVDVSRGNMLVHAHNQPQQGQDIEAMVCWFSEKPLKPGSRYDLMHNTNFVKCLVKEIDHKVNIENMDKLPAPTELEMNGIGKIILRTTQPLFYDSYRKNRATGSFILIDEATHVTVGACMIL
jgi:sulfate adenylyltransferase subunit 1